MGSTPGQHDDRFEQARLAGRVGAHDELRTGAEGSVQGGIPPEVEDVEGGQQSEPAPVPAVDPPTAEATPLLAIGRRTQEVVRTGITTWT